MTKFSFGSPNFFMTKTILNNLAQIYTCVPYTNHIPLIRNQKKTEVITRRKKKETIPSL